MILEQAFKEELKELLSANSMNSSDLDAIFRKLMKKAEDCANKVSEDIPGPPTYLTNELETLYCEMRIYIKRKEKFAGILCF
jgi:hypothetical protein